MRPGRKSNGGTEVIATREGSRAICGHGLIVSSACPVKIFRTPSTIIPTTAHRTFRCSSLASLGHSGRDRRRHRGENIYRVVEHDLLSFGGATPTKVSSSNRWELGQSPVAWAKSLPKNKISFHADLVAGIDAQASRIKTHRQAPPSTTRSAPLVGPFKAKIVLTPELVRCCSPSI